MNRIGRLILDIIGGAAAALALIFAIVALTGKLTDFHNLPDAAKKAIDDIKGLNGDVAYWFAVVGAGIGSLGMIGFAISIFLVFKKDSHFGLTMSIFVFAIIGLGLTSYSLYSNGQLGSISELGDDIKAIFSRATNIFQLN